MERSQECTSRTLADFSDSVWDACCRCVAIEIVGEAERAVLGPLSVQAVEAFFSLPRRLLDETSRFAEEHAEVCLAVRQEIPGMPIPEPWSWDRQQQVVALIDRLQQALKGLAQQHWGLTPTEAGFLAYEQGSRIKRATAARWEQGLREYYLAQRSHGEENPGRAVPKTKAKPARPRRARGKQTTEQILRQKLSTHEGRNELLAAGSARHIAIAIGRSESSVKMSEAWRSDVHPLLDSAKSMAKMARMEWDERRRDRKF